MRRRVGDIEAIGSPAVSRSGERARAAGKFLYVGDEKLYVRGVTYGTFRPDEQGREFDPDRVGEDFARDGGARHQRRPHLHGAAALAARRRRASTGCA